jgi:hypothetical protein
MKWYIVKESLRKFVENVTGLDAVYRNKRQQFVNPDIAGQAYLTVYNTRTRGSDEFRRTYDATTDKLFVNQNGIRYFILTVLVETYQEDDVRSALEYTERLRSAVERIPIVDDLRNTSGVVIVKVENSVDHTHLMDDHAVSSASVDVHLSIMDNMDVEDGPGLEPIDYINSAGITGTIEGTVNGTTAPDGDMEITMTIAVTGP